MGAKSTFLAAAVLDEVLGGTDYTAVPTVYIALFVSGVEVSGGSYARVAVTNDATNWPAASGTPRSKSNAADIVFPTASGSWGTIDSAAIMDAATSGDVLYSGACGPVAIASGAVAKFLAGNLAVSES